MSLKVKKKIHKTLCRVITKIRGIIEKSQKNIIKHEYNIMSISHQGILNGVDNEIPGYVVSTIDGA
jgi:hypothetical protein